MAQFSTQQNLVTDDEVRKKATCNGCRVAPRNWQCDFGFSIEPARELYGAVVEWKPKEPCYKPLTYAQYIKVNELRQES